MHVPNRPVAGTRRQLPDSMTAVAVGAGATTGEAVGAGVGAKTTATPDTVTESSVVTPILAAAVARDAAKSPELTAAETTAEIESAVALNAASPVTVTVKSRLASEDWSRLRRRESWVQSPASTEAPLIVSSIAATNTAASSAPSAKERGTHARVPRKRQHIAGLPRRAIRVVPPTRARATRDARHSTYMWRSPW